MLKDATMTDFSPLDDPAWNALTTDHATLGQRNGLAARYRTELSPLAGLQRYDEAAFADLRPLVGPEDAVALVSAQQYAVPDDWELLQAVPAFQMVWREPSAVSGVEPVRLVAADVEEMLELATATEPGPFRAGTIGTGRYFGLRAEDGRLMAMTGERMHLGGLTEVSAVCTWPEFRGRGLAKALVSHVSALIAAGGRVPFLHVKTENVAALALYERLGFSVRKTLEFKVVQPR
jgi:GNAT superfamily N-acetyltransferase